jgi:SRSO17 transposase
MKAGFGSRGSKSAGVGLQYCGTTGQVENCQVGVFLSYVTAKGHTLIDRELYLPLDWIEDPERCRAASIPETVRFQTKPEQAVRMIARIGRAQLPISWVVADTVYGGNLDLRTWLEEQGYAYVLAVACDEPVGIVTPDGQRRLVEVREVEALLLQEHDWQRLAMSEGTKGPRLCCLWHASRSCIAGKMMDSIGSSSAAVSLMPKRSAITWCSPHLEPPCRRW